MIGGQLYHYCKNWEVLTKDRWILETVRGYQIDFLSEPAQCWRPHSPQFNLSQAWLIQQEVEELQNKGVVIKLSPSAEEGFFSTLFLVLKKGGGQRPVVNLKALNKFVQMTHFKMEGNHTLKYLLQAGDWLAKVDLKNAYFAIPIQPEHRKYLRFSMPDRSYQFTYLPFSLALAPRVFTKTLRPIAALVWELGIE